MQARHADEAAPIYARAAQLNPADESLKAKVVDAQRQSGARVPNASPGPAPVVASSQVHAGAAARKPARSIVAVPRHPDAGPVHVGKAITVKAEPQPPAPAAAVGNAGSGTVYSNAAPLGRSN